MNATKRTLSILLVLVMIFGMLPISVFAATTPTVTLEEADAATRNPGDSFVVNVTLSNSTDGYFGYGMYFDYDETALTFVSVEAGDAATTAFSSSDAYDGPGFADVVYAANPNTAEGVLAKATFTVNDGATADTTINLIVDEFLLGDDDETDVAENFSTISVTIDIERAVTNAQFVNGTQTLSETDARNEAIGEWDDTLATPGNGYYFAGWFTGLTIEPTNGYYVIETPATSGTSYTGTELRPRYEDAVEGTVYNALWIKSDDSTTYNYVMTVGSNSFGIYYNTDADTVLTDAINGAAGIGRTKLVKDLSLTAQLQPTVSLLLDMNGCTISNTARVFYFTADYANGTRGTCTSATIDSGRVGGAITTSNTLVSGCAETAVAISDVKLESSGTASGALTLYAATLKNCVVNVPNTTYYAVKLNSGYTATFDGCEIHTAKGKTMQCLGTATITNCTMTAGSTAAPFYGKSLEGNGNITFGAGNTITAASAAALADYFTSVTFTSAGTYQIASTGSVCTNTTTVTCPVEGQSAGLDSNGYVVFGTPCTVQYMVNGVLKTSVTAMQGGYADLSYAPQVGNDNEYRVVGWTTDSSAATAMDQVLIEADTILYAVLARKGVIIGGTEFESGDASKSMAADGSALTIYNADRLNELDSLTISAAGSSLTKLVFSKEALSTIAEQINGESKDMSVGLYWNNSDVSDDAASKVVIALTYNGSAMTIPDGVQVQLATGTNTGGVGNYTKYVVYNTNDTATLIDSETVVNYHYCVYFDLTANGTYETKALDGDYLSASQTAGSKTVSLNGTDAALIVEDASKLADMTSLTVKCDDVTLTFSAAALDSIGAKAETDSVTIGMVYTESPVEGTAARAVLTVTDENNKVVDFTGSVDVEIVFPYTEGKSYRAYYVPTEGDPVGFGTETNIDSDGYMKAAFTTTHFSTYEVREATVAEGYTAGLYVTEDSVRAGGNTVNVTIDVTHNDSTADANDTTFNAAEIVVGYDPALLTPVTTGLTEGTYKVDETAGTLTIEVYGDAKNLGTAFNLQFKTCDSVDADTTATVTLTSAAFADSVDARSENLIKATLDPASDTVTIQLEAFDVVYDENVVTEGATTVVKGTDYSFTVEYPAYYDYSALKVYVGEGDSKTDITSNVTNDGSGTYTIPGTYVTGTITIEDNRVGNTYNVTINYTGDDADASVTETAQYATNYTFTIPTLEGYNYTLSKVMIGTGEYTDYSVSEGVLTITGTAITGDIVITIEKDDTLFSVTVEGNGAGDATWTESGNDNSVDKGDTVTLTVTPATGYKNYKVTATMAGAEVTLDNSTVNVYVLTDVDGDIVFTVTKEVQGAVTVSEYLTLDGDDSDGTSSSMFLVLYTDESANGSYIPTCNGEAMYWSDNYNAYCYLVIAETQTKAEESVVITAGAVTDAEGNAITIPTIDYSINVNCSSDTAGDAADAQLVYDMYQAMYSDFTTVGMLKFLLADVNNSKDITTEDAAYIINQILNPTTTTA